MTKPKRPTDASSDRPANAGGMHACVRGADGRFRKGVSGNPNGKAPGTRHKATEAVQSLLEGEAEALTRRGIKLALRGTGKESVLALRLCMERLAPAPRDRRVVVSIPVVSSAEANKRVKDFASNEMPTLMRGNYGSRPVPVAR